ncbi:MAG TPA: acyl-CoA dehydrogenase family protein [Pseudomonadales bacterium]|nr:acyl-CoA dehydrogenase family protein [Pseudomonadales bacterium]
MKICYTPEQQALKEKVARYMQAIMTPDLLEEKKDPQYFEGGGPVFREKMLKMGREGWLGLGWPVELGGKAFGPMEQHIFTEEVMAAGFPYPFLTVDTVGPMLAQHGSGFIRETVVKEILKGNIIISVGYSEPGAGTDLASLKTRADRDGDDWIINGQKVWTSLGHFADYVWLAARTNHDPAIKKHKGITIFLVPTSFEGFSCTPIHTLGMRTNATYYQDIRVPDKYRIGDVDGGWKLITGQLNRERLSIVNPGMVTGLLEQVCQWSAVTRDYNGEPLINTPWVKESLARTATELETLKLLCWKQAWAMQNGNPEMAASSAAKVYGSEFFVEAYRRLLEVVGQAGTLARDSVGAILQGKLEHRYRVASVLTFGGGTNEIQRDIIAAAGLWLPRAAR